MRHFRLIYFPLTAVTAVGVLIMALYAPLEAHDSGTIALPAEAGGVGHYVIDTLGGGSVIGTYATESGRDVLVMMLDDDQYEDYVAGRTHSSLMSVIASSGDFSVDDPGAERCHVVVEHATDPASAELVDLDYTVNSMDWNVVVIATALVFAPAFAAAIIGIKHTKDKRAALGPISKYDDVVIFDERPEK